MKKIAFLCLLILLMSIVSIGQIKDDDQMFGNKRELNPNAKNFGQLTADTTISYHFIIKATKEPIYIDYVYIPEGLSVTIIKEIITSESKHAGFIVTIFTSLLEFGSFSKDIILRTYTVDKNSGDKLIKETKYTIKGIVNAK